jgi:hypothetical protein
MLRIDAASNRLNENLFQRGLDEFEAVNGCHGRGLAQQLLGVTVLPESNLCVP